MKPTNEHFKGCAPELEELFRDHLLKLEYKFKDTYFYIGDYNLAAGFRILDMKLNGFYPLHALKASGVPFRIVTLDWDRNSQYFYDKFKAIIDQWSKLSRYRTMMVFADAEHLFLKATTNPEGVKDALGSQKFNWALKTEDEYNIFKAEKMLEVM